jgi:DHA2 family multidrug resistance protein
MGVMVGPILGPPLGGWLTDNYSWNWVFLINVPVGALCVTMLLLYMPETDLKSRRFDVFGFAMLALAIGAMQLMLDRGAENGWFESTETWLELGLVISGLWVFVVHSLTAAQPFIDIRIFKDRNFTLGSVFMFTVGITLFSGLALLPPLLQNLMGYPVILSSIMMAPRGLATMMSMMVVGRLTGKVDARLMMLFGIGMMSYSLFEMTHFDLQMDYWPVVITGCIQGFGMGFLFVPLSTMAFATIAPKYRADGTAMFSLVRNMGQGVGISLVTAVLSNMLQINHAELAERLTPTSQAVANQMPGLLTGAPQVVAMINGLVSQQAAMLSYLDDFWLMMLFSLSAVPLILLLRSPRKQARPAAGAQGQKADEPPARAMAAE